MTVNRPALAAVVAYRSCAWVLALAVVAAAVAIGLAIPRWLPLGIVSEGGAIESATLWAYLTAVLGICLLRWPAASWRDVAAACVVLLAMAAREADLHIALYGISILKSRFYLDASLQQILGALAVLLPIAMSACWLLYRYMSSWLRPPSRWSVPATTVALMIGLMVVAKVFDRTPALLGAWREQVPAALLHVMLALEEVVELSLPLFALLAMAQCRIGETALARQAAGLPRSEQRNPLACARRTAGPAAAARGSSVVTPAGAQAHTKPATARARPR
jgi:hypothetical protein